ncbi:MAG TPA: molybdopterin cofactor-binding domain-containing protein [Candidatus Acidoferrales bacterium]|nr:molybdopterin cofactor-binding domain-containing protein [Candidatus Acidoferrales bacterium]
MTQRIDFQFSPEPERYEFAEAPAYRFEPGRRDFFKLLGAGVAVLYALESAVAGQESGGGIRPPDEPLPKTIGAWLHIGEGGGVTVFTGKVEMGQNIRTSLSQGVSEELSVPLSAIEMVMGDTQRTPFDMGTFGSRTTPTMNLQLRRVAAAARNILIGLAAAQWNVDRQRLFAADGKISDKETKRSIEYGALVKGHEIAQVLAADDPLVPASQWKVAGQSAPKVAGRDFVTGAHRYPSDQKLPDMLYGKIVRPTSFNATLVSADTQEAEKIPGVTVVRDGNFIGVAAPSSAVATRAAAAIRAEWKADPQPSNGELFEYLKGNPLPQQEGAGASRYEVGAIEPALAAADRRLQQTYNVAYIAHAPLEPRAALAQWTGDQLTVSIGTQRPFAVRSELASAFRIPEEKIRVLVPDTGSAYGGKHTGETAVEAARLARAAKLPVKVAWTREEEFAWAYFRPAGVIEITSAVDRDSKITAWDFHNYNSGAAGIRTFYDIPNQRIEFHPTKSPLRQGSYRGLAATANHFAREVHMDELAHLAKMDPLEFRMKNLKDERLRAVFSAAAEKFGWAKGKTEGHGHGIGGGFEKLGNVATAVEVAVDRATGRVTIVRVVTAFECGAIVNPDQLRNQVEGANIMGLGGALFEEIEFENGRILNGRFSKYRLPRFSDIPPVETVLLDRKDLPSAGAGEAPIVGIAPAIANAIFDATGVRLRSLPLIPHGLKLS